MKKLILFLLLFSVPAFGQYTIGQWTAANRGGSSTASTPTFSPGAGTYSSTQTVTISTATPLAVLCYTTDGTTPTESANLCSGGTTSTYTTPITVSTTQTVQAIATLVGYTDSSVGNATYTISAASIAHIGTPACTQTLSSGATTLTTASYSATSGSTIYLAIDTLGTAPTPTVVDSGTYNSYSQQGSTVTANSYYNALMFGTGADANTRTGAMTFTASPLKSGHASSICVSEYSGVLHIGSSTTATGNGATYSISVTAPEANDWLVCSISDYGNTASTALSGTIRAHIDGDNGGTIQDYNSTSTTLTVSGTITSGYWAATCTVLRSL
jgi:hypothetical protein